MTKATDPGNKGNPLVPLRDAPSDCCVVSRQELLHLRANQARPDRPLVVLLTGLRKGGIGHAAGKLLTSRGHTVIAVERDREPGQDAVRDIRDHGGDIWGSYIDASDEEQVQRLMEVIDRRWGRLDAVINNAGWAGQGKVDTFLDLDATGFRQLLEANLVSAFVVTRAAIRSFLLRQPEGGTCVFLASTNGQPGNGSQLGYAAAKTALSALVRVGVAHHGRANCRFLLLRPGLVETDSAGWKRRREKDPQYARKEGQKVPLGRLAKPQEVAEVIAFLLRPETAYINGAEINVDGGLLASGNMLPGDAAIDRDAYVELINLVSKAGARQAA